MFTIKTYHYSIWYFSIQTKAPVCNSKWIRQYFWRSNGILLSSCLFALLSPLCIRGYDTANVSDHPSITSSNGHWNMNDENFKTPRDWRNLTVSSSLWQIALSSSKFIGTVRTEVSNLVLAFYRIKIQIIYLCYLVLQLSPWEYKGDARVQSVSLRIDIYIWFY